VAISVVAVHLDRLHAIEFGRAFVAAASAIVGTVLTCTAALLMALADADLDGPRALPAGSSAPAQAISTR